MHSHCCCMQLFSPFPSADAAPTTGAGGPLKTETTATFDVNFLS